MTASVMRLHYIVLALSLILAACTRAVYEPRLRATAESPQLHESEWIKAHLHSGDLLVLDSWTETDSTLQGRGLRYSPARQLKGPSRNHEIALDSIALLEVDVRSGSRPTGVVGIAIWSVLYGAVTLACVADPKSCFGSCPTFYVASDTGAVLVAEGFSDSILRALEASDLDAMFHAHSAGGSFAVTMRNEALETHAVRSLRLKALPRPANGRVFMDSNEHFYPSSSLAQPLECSAPEGDCLPELAMLDGNERTSPSDSLDLATRETIELLFPSTTGRLGLVLAARQSLLTTYLFYQTMGFLGRRAGEEMAALERAGPAEAKRAMEMGRLVGTIDVDVWDGAAWKRAGTHNEAGPLAIQVTVFPFEHQDDGPVRVRLLAPKGAWRLDWAALAVLDEQEEPVVVEPLAVSGDGVSDSLALELLLDPDRHLVTYPGESFEITFSLPPVDGEWELFLESQGFYYEWMRAEWLEEENLLLAALVRYDPARALKILAPGFKQAEPQMEERFWNSRFSR